jgi:hypothetical protein
MPFCQLLTAITKLVVKQFTQNIIAGDLIGLLMDSDIKRMACGVKYRKIIGNKENLKNQKNAYKNCQQIKYAVFLFNG